MKSDSIENNLKIDVFDTKKNEFVQIPSKQLYPGHIIKVKNESYLPSDIVLIYTSEEKGNCYVETKNIDGETNLEQKNVHLKLQKYI